MNMAVMVRMMVFWRRSRGRATSLPLAIIHALQQTFIQVETAAHLTNNTIETHDGSPSMIMFLIEAELRLDSSAMNAVGMQALPRLPGQLHVLLAAALADGEGDLDVHGGDELGVAQLPDVDVVAADDARDVLDVFFDVVDVDVVGCCLEEDLSRCFGERDGGLEDDERDEEGDDGVGVEAVLPAGEPDGKGGDDYSNVAESISDDMEDHSVHTHVGVIVASSLRRFLGLVVVMGSMPRIVCLLGSVVRIVIVVVMAMILWSASFRLAAGSRSRQQGRVLSRRLRIIHHSCFLPTGVFLALRPFHRRLACCNYFLSETGWVYAHVIYAGKTATDSSSMLAARRGSAHRP